MRSSAPLVSIARACGRSGGHQRDEWSTQSHALAVGHAARRIFDLGSFASRPPSNSSRCAGNYLVLCYCLFTGYSECVAFPVTRYDIRTGMRSIPVSVALRQRHRCPFGALNKQSLFGNQRFSVSHSSLWCPPQRVRSRRVGHSIPRAWSR